MSLLCDRAHKFQLYKHSKVGTEESKNREKHPKTEGNKMFFYLSSQENVQIYRAPSPARLFFALSSSIRQLALHRSGRDQKTCADRTKARFHFFTSLPFTAFCSCGWICNHVEATQCHLTHSFTAAEDPN